MGALRPVLRRAVAALARLLFGPAILSRLPADVGDDVCLTFDDGPHDGNTEQILAILEAHGVRATFFVAGEACDAHPHLVRAVAEAGHQVANHGYSHYAPHEVSRRDYLEDVDRGQAAIERALGHPVPKLFRPPYGRISIGTFVGLWRRGYQLVLWNVDSRDSFVTDPDDVAENVLTAPVRPRSIVLLHEDYDWTVAALPGLLADIRGRGMGFRTIAEPGAGVSAAAAHGTARMRAARMPRIALVAEFPPPAAGMTVQAETLRARLTKEGVDVVPVVTNTRLTGGLAWLQRVRFLRGAIAWVRFAAQLPRLASADLIHVFSASWLTFFLFSAPAVVVARVLGRPCVLHYHGGGAGEFLDRWHWLARTFLRSADCIVVPSEFLLEVFRARGYDALTIANPVDVPVPTRRATSPVVLSCRNLYPVYDVATAVDAFALLHAHDDAARMIVAGDGPERTALEQRTRDHGIEAAVTFVGNVDPDEMARLRSAATVLVNSSRSDNQPVSLIEGMASGLAIASTDAGGIPVLVQDGREALLVPVGDAGALGEALIRIVDDTELRDGLVRAARGRAREFSWREVGPRWLDLYAKLTGRGGDVQDQQVEGVRLAS